MSSDHLLIADLPNIRRITSKLVSRLTVVRSIHPAINGYGVHQGYAGTLEILDSFCPFCNRWAFRMPMIEQIAPPRNGCHLWRKHWFLVGDAQEQQLGLLAEALEKKAEAFADELKL